MSEAAEKRTVSAFPPPPSYYKLFTDERLAMGAVPAPPEPIIGTYTMFGQNYTTEVVEPTLEEQVYFIALSKTFPDGHLTPPPPKISLRINSILLCVHPQGKIQLYPKGEINHTKELKKLNHSLLYNFLELLDTVIKNPRGYTFREKIEDLELLFVNMHHLLNSFRPHQAREALISIMQGQLKKRNAVLDDAKSSFAKVNEFLDKANQILQESTNNSMENISFNEEEAEEREEGQEPKEDNNVSDDKVLQKMDSLLSLIEDTGSAT